MLAVPLLLLSILPHAFGCPHHQTRSASLRNKRSDDGSSPDWTYNASYDWGTLSPDYALCQTGTSQSPISLKMSQGLSSSHQPDFSGYKPNVTGEYYNWGHGPAFSFYHPDGDHSGLPSIKVDDEVLYMKGWHTHAPSDHVIDGASSRAELHLVQYVTITLAAKTLLTHIATTPMKYHELLSQFVSSLSKKRRPSSPNCPRRRSHGMIRLS